MWVEVEAEAAGSAGRCTPWRHRATLRRPCARAGAEAQVSRPAQSDGRPLGSSALHTLPDG